jgi:hypothetical protein
MHHVYPRSPTNGPVEISVLTSFTPRHHTHGEPENAEIRSEHCAGRNVDSEFRVVRVVR